MATEPADQSSATMNAFDDVGDDDSRREECPPDGGYGWICVAACFTINCFTWGTVSVRLPDQGSYQQRHPGNFMLCLASIYDGGAFLIASNYADLFFQAYGIYLSHYLTEDIFREASTWDYAFIGGFNFSIAMIIAPIVTILTRRFGIHTIMLAGLVFQNGGFIAASFATRIWQLHISQGVLIGCGIGFLYIPSLPILSQWFAQRRSLANGISAAGSGVGGAAFAWGTEAIIQRCGVGWALRITGIIALAANFAAITVLRDRNQVIQPSQLGFDTKLIQRYDVVLLLAWAFISMLGYVVLLFSLSDFALSIGLTRAQATDVIGLLNVGTAVGRPLIGILSDRWSRIDMAGVLTLLCGLSCFMFWLPATSPGLTIFFAIICGAIVGVFWMVRWVPRPFSMMEESANPLLAQTIGPLCVEVAGVKNLQSLLSLSWAAVVIPATGGFLNFLPTAPADNITQSLRALH
jgi:predicted MFS family arabinose efflux permease